MGRYALPDLGYDYDALEPHLSAEILQLHHDQHHRTYVEGANRASDELEEAREADDPAWIAACQRSLAFNLSGHFLHSIFWNNLSPFGGDIPDGELGETIERDLGGFDAFKKLLVAAAAETMGSGWGALLYDPMGRRLVTACLHDHQSEMALGGVPLLVLDAWEHAYYLQYRADKKRYFEAMFNLWSWRDVQARFAAARAFDLGVGAPLVEEPGPAH
jgi:Fe-Mn family superoxide dismutase